jgi:hypothetical protein
MRRSVCPWNKGRREGRLGEGMKEVAEGRKEEKTEGKCAARKEGKSEERNLLRAVMQLMQRVSCG